MTVKIITDSVSDITSDMAEELGVTVIPLTVLFGHDAFLDRVTISPEEFFHRLTHDNIWPTTTQPSPGAFAEIYDRLAEETDEIMVITLSSKISGTYQSAMAAKELTKKKCRIEVIDSLTVAMGLGLVVIATAKEAGKGAGLDELIAFTRRALQRSHFIAYFDTVTYLAKGGRIGKARGLLGAMLSVKPILIVDEGEMSQKTRMRSLGAGMDYLYNFVAGFSNNIEELAVEYTTTPDEADRLVERLSAIYPQERIYRSTVSPVLGTYGGPGAIAITVLEAEKK